MSKREAVLQLEPSSWQRGRCAELLTVFVIVSIIIIVAVVVATTVVTVVAVVMVCLKLRAQTERDQFNDMVVDL